MTPEPTDRARTTTLEDYRAAVQDNDSLVLFVARMREFDRHFCDLMVEGQEFTLRLEVCGKAGDITHCRVFRDVVSRPKGRSRNRGRRRA